MTLLVDTNVLLLWVYDPARLSARAHAALRSGENRLLWSVASTWEVAIKVGLGKLRLDGPVGEVLPAELLRHEIGLLPIANHHALRVADLPAIHGDPFDRLIFAQALVEGIALVTADTRAAAYGVAVVW